MLRFFSPNYGYLLVIAFPKNLVTEPTDTDRYRYPMLYKSIYRFPTDWAWIQNFADILPIFFLFDGFCYEKVQKYESLWCADR